MIPTCTFRVGMRECPRQATHRGLCGPHYQYSRQRARVQSIKDDPRLNFLKITHGGCLRAEGPCGATLCRYHLQEPRTLFKQQDLSEPCAMKIAEAKACTLEEVGAILGVTRERVRQIEMGAIRKLSAHRRALGA